MFIARFLSKYCREEALHIMTSYVLFVALTRQCSVDVQEDKQNGSSWNCWRGCRQEKIQSQGTKVELPWQRESYPHNFDPLPNHNCRLPVAVEEENCAYNSASGHRNSSNCFTRTQDGEVGTHQTSLPENPRLILCQNEKNMVMPSSRDGLSKLFALRAASEMIEAEAKRQQEIQQHGNSLINEIVIAELLKY